MIKPEVTYVSGENVRLYIDAIELDAAYFDFTYQHTKLPIYGYKSEFFDFVADGIVLIQGTIALNVTQGNELRNTLIKAGKVTSQNFAYHNYQIDNLIAYIIKEGDVETPITLATYYEFNGILISEKQQVLGPEGQPIMELYTFIANNIRDGQRGNIN